ncbi:family 20 glycosylhydrolase [Lentisphaera marina]|uniref:beta-N-acetylhexosaminidase n=1 Tax=Lentisphaera marina TaxID=1111041 RepID=UPI00236582C2|nr:family 20 glycosylhydrolase [Lentisphaera marina]MDD7984925.1 family 20 glycosylhydrolase [Lentisphaera marina]
MSHLKRYIRARAKDFEQINIIPKPQFLKLGQACFVFEKELSIEVLCESAVYASEVLRNDLCASLNICNTARKSILFEKTDMPEEAYSIDIELNSILIKAHDSVGFLYAVYSLKQLLPIGDINLIGHNIPLLQIRDFPRFSWRSFTLDCSRQFFSVDTLKRLFDQLSFYKINVFHWHLCDDEGWRLEIDSYPDLTNKGAWRGPNEVLPPDRGSGQKRYGGFYSKDEVRELIKYAALRGIEIIPEIDIPGHSLAIVNSYPETRCSPVSPEILEKGVKLNTICPSKETNLEFIKNILTEVADLFPSKYIHIGNDEVERSHWANCHSCQGAMKKNEFMSSRDLQNLFFRQVHQFIKSLNKEVVAWNESLSDPEMPKDTTIMSWEGVEPAKEALSRAVPVILCPGQYCYIDMAQGPFERGHSWAGFLDMEKVYSYEVSKDLGKLDLVKGYGICLWAEYLDQKDFIWKQIFPRLLAASEVAWSQNKSWGGLINRYKKFHCYYLKEAQLISRINKAELIYKDETVSVIKQSPHDQIYFTVDASLPNEASELYQSPVGIEDVNLFRARLLSPCGTWSELSPVPNFDDIQVKSYRHFPYKLKTYRKARYQEPESNAGKGNRELYVWVPTPYMPGEYIDFTFDTILKAKHLEVRTGVPKTLRSLVEKADLFYSNDGVDFQKLTEFHNGIAQVKIDSLEIKLLRILFNKEQSEWTAIQELLIKA